jgi:hypothetical protein
VVEEGALHSSRDFRMREADAYPALYQESAARSTRDKGINDPAGPHRGRLDHRQLDLELPHPARDAALLAAPLRPGRLYRQRGLAPWFALMEARLRIGDWEAAPNENNDLLQRGAGKLGIPTGFIRRNVNGCWNLGYCGMGCPTNAKQSMLVTTIPVGARAWRHPGHARARRAPVLRGDASTRSMCTLLDAGGIKPTGRRLRLRARHFVLAGGAINSPALLLRSKAPDPSAMLGKRTFLHPTLISAAFFPQRVEGWAGAPQTVYSDHFLHTQAIDGALGYKLEAPPLHPVLLSTTMAGFGAGHAALMRQFPQLQGMLALLRDGFHPASQGGSVALTAPAMPCSTIRSTRQCATAPARAADDGRDPVRRRRRRRAAGPRTGAALCDWSAARQGIKDLMPQAAAPDAASPRPT